MSKLFFCTILFVLSACSRPDQDAYYGHKTTESISKLSTIEPPPPVFSFTPVFVLGENDSVVVTTFQKLKHIYSASYAQDHKSFTDFLFEALNQKVKLSGKDMSVRVYYEQVFKTDTGVSALYKDESINGLIKRYAVTHKDGYTLKKDRLSLNEINSISFYFFMHQFIRQDDDYNASIHFRKLLSLLGDLGKDNTEHAANTILLPYRLCAIFQP